MSSSQNIHYLRNHCISKTYTKSMRIPKCLQHVSYFLLKACSLPKLTLIFNDLTYYDSFSSFLLFLSPYPPPPGVCITNLSPFLTSIVFLDPTFVIVSPDRSKFIPFDPFSPPANPNGANTLRSLRILTFKGHKNSNSLVMPSPPRKYPSPPLPYLISNLRSKTGYLLSNTSGSVIRVFVIWHFVKNKR